jgi:hypothetical protein
MPHSSHLPLTTAMEHVVRLAPRTVLDIGAGLGKWGFLIREALDFMDGRLERAAWKTRIVGLDAQPHPSPLHDWVYDELRTADVRDERPTGYDLVVLGDVVEHLKKDEGLRLLERLAAANRNVLVMTPLHYFDQEVEGMPYETHRSHWTRADFAPWAHDYDVVGGASIVVLLAGAGAARPTRSDARASGIAYAIPGLRNRGAAARVVKELARKLL